MAKPLFKRFDCGSTQRHDALFGTFTPNHNTSTSKVEILGAKTAHFRHAQSTSVKKFKHRVVARANRWRIIRSCPGRIVENLREFIVTKNARKSTSRTGSTETSRGVGSEMTTANKPCEVAAQRGGFSGNRTSRKFSRGHSPDVSPQNCAADIGRHFDVLAPNPFDKLIDITSISAQSCGRDRRQRRLELIKKPRVCVASHKQNCNGER